MADAPPAASGQRSVTLDIGAIGSGLGDGIDIEEAYRLVAAAMENDAELMAAVGAARERAVEKLARFMLRQGAPPGFVVASERGGYSVDGLARGQLSQRRLGPLFYEYLFTRSA